MLPTRGPPIGRCKHVEGQTCANSNKLCNLLSEIIIISFAVEKAEEHCSRTFTTAVQVLFFSLSIYLRSAPFAVCCRLNAPPME